MITYDVQKAVAGVQFLVNDNYFSRRVRQLWNLVARPRALPYKGEAAVLNELIVIGRQSPNALGSLIALAEFKRDNYNDYQRAFMAAKRKRQSMFIATVEKVHGRLTLEARKDLLVAQQAVWDKQRDEYVKENSELYEQRYGEKPGWSQVNEMKREFWLLLDAQLEKVLEQAAHVVRTKKREVVLVKETPSAKVTKMQQAFAAIVDMKK